MNKVLINGVTVTDATKQEFRLKKEDFAGSSLPGLKSRGLGTGDVVTIFEYVNGGWEDSGSFLDPDTKSLIAQSLGRYAVSIVMTTAGPASVELETSGRQ